jgi:hypothetical protein
MGWYSCQWFHFLLVLYSLLSLSLSLSLSLCCLFVSLMTSFWLSHKRGDTAGVSTMPSLPPSNDEYIDINGDIYFHCYISRLKPQLICTSPQLTEGLPSLPTFASPLAETYTALFAKNQRIVVTLDGQVIASIHHVIPSLPPRSADLTDGWCSIFKHTIGKSIWCT